MSRIGRFTGTEGRFLVVRGLGEEKVWSERSDD